MCILEHEYETFCVSFRPLRRNYNFDFLEELLGKGKKIVMRNGLSVLNNVEVLRNLTISQ